MKTRRVLLALVAALGALGLEACDMGYNQKPPDIPKPITCGPGTVDTGLKCDAGTCPRH